MAFVRYDGAQYEVDDANAMGLLTKLDKVIESGRMRNVSVRTVDGGIISFLLCRRVPVLVEFPNPEKELEKDFTHFVTDPDPEKRSPFPMR